MKKVSLLVAVAVLCVGVSNVYAGCGTCDKTVVEVAVKTDGFKTLVAAVKAADLAETLSGKGPFTVFAPTDEAFKKLPKETLAELLKPENKKKLAAILARCTISTAPRAKFDATTAPTSCSLARRSISLRSSVLRPVVPITRWMPCAVAVSTVGMTAWAVEKSTRTSGLHFLRMYSRFEERGIALHSSGMGR